MTSENLAKRLGQAIKLAGLSRRAFGRRMAELDPEDGGRTYPAINSYLKGRTLPPLDVVEAMADVLGVRPAWLAWGDGEITPEAEAEARAGTGAAVALPVAEAIQETLEAAFPAYARIHPVHQRSVRTAVTVLYRTNMTTRADSGGGMEAGGGYDPDVPPGMVDAARAVGQALQAPFDTMGVNPDDIDDLRLYRYMQAACDALLHLVDQRQLGLFVIRPRRP